MAKRNYPNDYYAWYNDDDRIAILERVTSTDSSQTHREVWDSFQSSGDLSGDITTFADYTGTVSGTTRCVTSEAHGLETGDRVSITSSPDADLDGNYAITKIDADEFYIVKAHVAETEGTWNSLFIDNGLRLTYHSKYEAVTASSLTSELSTTNGLDTGMQTSLLYYMKARLLEDQGNLQQAQYFRQMYEREVKRYPSRKSGIRTLAVPRI